MHIAARSSIAFFGLSLLVGACAQSAPNEPSKESSAALSDESAIAAADPALWDQLKTARDANIRFAAGPQVAIDEGLGLLPGHSGTCRYNPAAYDGAGGGMGYHYTSVPLIVAQASKPLDITKPDIVIYTPQDDGSMKLAALEWVVPILVDGHLYTGTTPPPLPDTPPTIFGQEMKLRSPINTGEDKNPFWNYQLHVWLYEKNPDGIFEQWNRKVKCTFDGSDN